MWHAPTSVSVTAEPVSRDLAKPYCRVDGDGEDPQIDLLIAAARAHAERYCNAVFARQVVEVACDGWADLDRLPLAPLHSVASLAYVDLDGEDQVLDPDVYVARPDGYSPSVVLARGETWPAVQPGSRITLAAVFGYGDACPADVVHAILLLISQGFHSRLNEARPAWAAVDSLLCNHRRGAW